MSVLGRYFVIKSQLNGLVLDVRGSEMDSGTEVITFDYHGKDNQLWYEDPVGHAIRSKCNDNFALDLCDENKLIINEFEPTKSTQHWICSGDYLRQRDTGKVADIAGASEEAGATVLAFEQHGGPNQRWTFEYEPRKYFQIKSRMNDKCLDICGAAPEPGTSVVMYESHGNDNQLWYEDRHGNIYSKLNKLSIVSTDDGLITAPLDMSDDHVALVKNGPYLENRSTDTMCLDICGASDDDGAKVVLYEKHGGDNQQWYFDFV